MEPTEHRSSAIGPSIHQNALDSLQFNEEIRHLMTVPPDNANSFTALLELPASQAVELLHQHPPESNDCAARLTVKADGRHHHTPFHFNPGANLTFPSNSALIERNAKFSVFAGEHNNINDNIKNKSSTDNIYTPETTVSLPSNASRNLGKMKNEPAESDSNNNDQNSSQPSDIKTENQNQNHRTAKRKEREKKGKASTKKSKTGANDSSEDAEKLPYVHVRARRGQATDSHSLAERARREKINARMKLLQELVPGCNKISGTALVLDEIINHVQSLQHQVEFLSMRLAAVNPRTDFNLDSILAAEGEALTDNNFPGMIMPVMWPEVPGNGNRQQWHNFDGHQQQQQPFWGREEESHNFVTPENSSANSAASLHSNQLKMEL